MSDLSDEDLVKYMSSLGNPLVRAKEHFEWLMADDTPHDLKELVMIALLECYRIKHFRQSQSWAAGKRDAGRSGILEPFYTHVVEGRNA